MWGGGNAAQCNRQELWDLDWSPYTYPLLFTFFPQNLGFCSPEKSFQATLTYVNLLFLGNLYLKTSGIWVGVIFACEEEYSITDIV